MKRSLVILLLPLVALGGCHPDGPHPDAAVPAVKRPFLRDNVRREDLVCGDEPSGRTVATVRAAGEYIVDLREWGRDCKRRGETGWSVIRNEAGS